MEERVLVHETREGATDRRVIRRVLQGGLWSSVVLMSLGLMIELFQGGDFSQGLEMDQVFVSGLSVGFRLMGIGIWVLALTPAVRVGMLLLLWVREKDWRFAMISLAVLLSLSFSIWLG